MRKGRFGTLLICLGTLLLLAAGGLTMQNHLAQQQAGEDSQQILEQLALPSRKPAPSEPAATTAPEIPEHPAPDEPTVPYVPDYVLHPEMPMPEVQAGGYACIGVLWLPALELELPVISTTTKKALKVAPCRFSGSVYQDDLVIGAHNYSTHFGRIDDLPYGSEIEFVDMEGNVFLYRVADIEILQPHQAEELCSGEWPLSLYTCTYGGQTRIVVRCEKVG